MRSDKHSAVFDRMEFLVSIIDLANARLLASGFEKLARLFGDLARKADDRRITREVANDVCMLSG
jgi:hypothetical protein